MALETFHSTIVIPGPANPNPTPIAVSATSVPFLPKLVLYWCACATMFDSTLTGVLTCFGAARTTTEQFTIAAASDGSGTSSNTGRISRFGTECICLPLNGTPAIDALATLVSLNANGFTVNCTDKAATDNMEVEYLALGGSDITNVKILEVTPPTNVVAAQTQAINFGFPPDLVLAATPAVPSTTGIVDAHINLGIARRDPTTQQYAASWFENDGTAAMDTLRYSTQSRMLAAADATSVKDWDISLASWDATGVTIRWDDPPAAINPPTARLYMIAIQGGQYELEYITTPTATGTVPYSTAITPKGLFAFGSSDTTDTDTTVITANGDAGFVLGACDSGLRQGDIAVIQTDNSATSANSLSKRRQSKTRFMSWMTGTTGTLAADGQVTALGNTSFDINWTTATAGTRNMVALVMGEPPAINPIPRVVHARGSV